MKKIMAVAVVVAMFALSSTTLMAAPTKGATQAADQSGLFAKVFSSFSFVTISSDATQGKGKGSKTIKNPGKSTNDGAIWVGWCRTYGC